MAVCAPDKSFTFIQAGFPGSAHDARVFKLCSLYTKMQQHDATYFPSPHFHIVGDSAFGLHKYLMVPFKNTGNLSAAQLRSNRKLSMGRVNIENTFALLKCRFRRLKFISADIDRIPKIFKACCVLHNIALHYSDDLDLLENEGALKEHVQNQNIEPEWNPPPHIAGVQKREALVLNL